MGGASPTILTVVEVVASVVAGPEVGMAIMEATTGMDAIAVAGTYGMETVAAVGAAATSGASSAINTAAAGGDVSQVLTSAAEGATAGAAGSFVGSEVGQALGPGPSVDGVPGEAAPVSPTVQKAAASGAGGATAGFSRAELGGSNLQTALRQGAVGGITSAAGSLLFPTDASSDTADKSAAAVGKTLLGAQIAQMLAPTATSSSRGGTTQTAGAGGVRGAVSGPSGYGDTSTGGGGVGSQALSQVLNLGSPTSAYSDTGAGGEQTSPETGGKPQNVWNLASLRVKDATGGEA